MLTGKLFDLPLFKNCLAFYRTTPAPPQTNPPLNDEQKAALRCYAQNGPGTEVMFRPYNCFLTNPRSGLVVPPWVSTYTDYLGKAFAALPAHNAAVFRGTLLYVRPTVNQVIKNLGYLAAATEAKVAHEFMLEKKGQDTYVIEFPNNSGARKLHQFAAVPVEVEVVIPAGQCWRVLTCDLIKSKMSTYPWAGAIGTTFPKGITDKEWGIRLEKVDCTQDAATILEVDHHHEAATNSLRNIETYLQEVVELEQYEDY
jgi:hypothetical protein